MKKLILALVLAIILAGCGSLPSFETRQRFSQTNVSLIHKGMSIFQVEALFGKPDYFSTTADTNTNEALSTIDYGRNWGQTAIFTFRDNKLSFWQLDYVEGD
jgi:hypothetical protein